MSRSEKPFDCLEYKARVQAEIAEELHGLSTDEQIAYYRRAAETGPFAEWLKRVEQDMARRKASAA